MAGPGGFEPPNAGIKTRCLNRLATAQQMCRSATCGELYSSKNEKSCLI